MPFRWIDTITPLGEVDRTRATTPIADTAIDGVPPNGQIFQTVEPFATERA